MRTNHICVNIRINSSPIFQFIHSQIKLKK